MNFLDPSEYAPYHKNYLLHISDSETDAAATLNSDLEASLTFFRSLSESQSEIVHTPYTWSTKEVVGHMTDTERVFGYRGLCFARGDKTPLPSFDENDYAKVADFNRYKFDDLIEEYEAVRRSLILFFRHLPQTDVNRRGIANNAELSVRAVAYIIIGHTRHHMTILRKRFAS